MSYLSKLSAGDSIASFAGLAPHPNNSFAFLLLIILRRPRSGAIDLKLELKSAANFRRTFGATLGGMCEENFDKCSFDMWSISIIPKLLSEQINLSPAASGINKGARRDFEVVKDVKKRL